MQAIEASKVAAETGAKVATDTKSSIEKDAASIKASNERISAILSAIEKIHADISTALKEVTAVKASVTEAKATAEAGATTIQAHQQQVSEIAAKVASTGTVIAETHAESQKHLTSIKNSVETTSEIQNNINDYYKTLSEFHKAYTDLHSKIEGLLPNATSAGLASAFRNQKDRFKWPQKIWLGTFITAIFLLLAAGSQGILGFLSSGTLDTWDSILRHIISRLPIIAPLVWLAIYAGRNYTLALRLQEEYAFKEAVSTAFEGYKRQMAEISGTGENALSPIVTLCENVLQALAQRPGRIYEGVHNDVTPLTPIMNAIDKLTDLAKSEKK